MKRKMDEEEYVDFEINCTPEQHKMIATAAERSGQTMDEFMNAALLTVLHRARRIVETRRAIRTLARARGI
jgi:uncharacterized protein (DUF1778 family)